MPVFKKDAPQDLCKLPVSHSTQQYVYGYEGDEFCLHCKKVVTIFSQSSVLNTKFQQDLKSWENLGLRKKFLNVLKGVKRPLPPDSLHITTICPCCGETGSFMDADEGAPCHRCEEGLLQLDESKTVSF
ncbi:hypothetical protein KC926_02685 [Candidatus Kaiserbacteria bacterium]|nr:hypothetical protein [Candidatus Kaiserbacteria bacterium]